MAFVKTGAGVSEIEQVLFYSIPGSIFLLFVGLFIILHFPEVISLGLVAAGVASALPIGFLLYQAYTANMFWIYNTCLKRRKQRCLVPIQRKFQTFWKNGDPEEIYHLSKRVLTQITNEDKDAGPYIWRLVDIINARGLISVAGLIIGLKKSVSFRDATLKSEHLGKIKKLSAKQINEIARAAVENNQIYESFKAKPNLCKLFSKHIRLIEPRLLEKLREHYSI